MILFLFFNKKKRSEIFDNKEKYADKKFNFSDADFFHQHIDACCRVAAVYAFFLLGHRKDSKTYTVRYDKNTHEACEVKMEKILADTFYNRNCYGSLYRVKQKSEDRRQPMVDLDESVDRTYMTNRHQSQFIGQDLLSRLHLKVKESSPMDCDSDYEMEYDDHINELLKICHHASSRAFVIKLLLIILNSMMKSFRN